MTPLAQAILDYIDKVTTEALEQLEGIPDDDLNTWRPKLGLRDINTFFALTTHLIAAGEYWILHAAGGQWTDRDRPAEFRATGDLESLKARFAAWRADSEAMLSTLTDEDLGRRFVRGGDEPVDQSAARCLVHAVAHAATHVGHLQLQRQIWDAEHGQ
jgi:uncharacterized damage-inducible protein DinB